MMRRVYKNPWSLALKYLKHEEIHELELKNDVKITADKLLFVNIYSLAKLLNLGWSIKDSERNYLTLCKDVCIKVRLNEGNDVGHIIEIFGEKAYGDSFRDYTVIDVGASNGDSSIFFALRGAKRVFGLKPFPQSYSLALENVKMNNMEDKVVILDYALSDRVGKEKLIVFEDMPNAATISEDGTYVRAKIEKRIQVKTINLEKLVSNFNIEIIDLLKMDCEGCEYKVFRSLEPRVLNKIKDIYMEYHKGYEELKKDLENNGFEVTLRPSTSNSGLIVVKNYH